jgi:hypothetical protein
MANAAKIPSVIAALDAKTGPGRLTPSTKMMIVSLHGQGQSLGEIAGKVKTKRDPTTGAGGDHPSREAIRKLLAQAEEKGASWVPWHTPVPSRPVDRGATMTAAQKENVLRVASQMFEQEPSGTALKVSRIQAKLGRRLVNPETEKQFHRTTVAGVLKSSQFMKKKGVTWEYGSRGKGTRVFNPKQRVAFAKSALEDHPPAGSTPEEFWENRIIGIDFAYTLVPQTEFKLEGVRLAQLGTKGWGPKDKELRGKLMAQRGSKFEKTQKRGGEGVKYWWALGFCKDKVVCEYIGPKKTCQRCADAVRALVPRLRRKLGGSGPSYRRGAPKHLLTDTEPMIWFFTKQDKVLGGRPLMRSMQEAFAAVGAHHYSGQTANKIPIESPDLFPHENLIKHIKKLMGPPKLREAEPSFKKRLRAAEDEANAQKTKEGDPVVSNYSGAYMGIFEEVLEKNGRRLDR